MPADPAGDAMNPNENDAVIDEIRKVRHRISERFDHDPERLVAYYMELQQRDADRLIDTSKVAEKEAPSGVSGDAEADTARP
jgi:hypothetical protein